MKLINDILDLSKIESGRLNYNVSEVELRDICQEAYVVQSLKMTSDVALLYNSVAMPSVRLWIDPHRVEQVLLNLLSNAIKFTSKGFISLFYEVEEALFFCVNITFSAGKNTVEVLCMTEKTGLEKTVVFNLKSANESDVNNIVNEKGHESRSFYYKLGLLYFLNIVDWICTEALIGSGHFVEANPVMQPVLENFWLTLLIKGILPLVLILGCALIYKLAEIGRSKTAEMLLTVGIVSYALVNLWHIFNFVLLFCRF